MRKPLWTDDDVTLALDGVRQVLLSFLRDRTRLEWFKSKVRWQITRRYIWPGAPQGVKKLIEDLVGNDAGVSAFVEHLRSRQRSISDAIEKYNTAVQRLMEQQRGAHAADFDEASKQELRERRITFQGTREELLRQSRGLTAESGPELFPELLSMRLAIVTEEVRDEIFREVSTRLADEATMARHLSQVDRSTLAAATEARLRCLDRYHVARLMSENYAEARRLMNLDELLERYERLGRPDLSDSDEQARARKDLRAVIGSVVRTTIGFLEELYPSTAGMHDRELRTLCGEIPDEPTE